MGGPWSPWVSNYFILIIILFFCEKWLFQDEACIRERDGPEGVCDSKACEEASKRMVAFMKKGVDPCKDFYQFACGGIRDQQPYQPSSSFNMLQARVDDHLHSEWTILRTSFFSLFFFSLSIKIRIRGGFSFGSSFPERKIFVRVYPLLWSTLEISSVALHFFPRQRETSARTSLEN